MSVHTSHAQRRHYNSHYRNKTQNKHSTFVFSPKNISQLFLYMKSQNVIALMLYDMYNSIFSFTFVVLIILI